MIRQGQVGLEPWIDRHAGIIWKEMKWKKKIKKYSSFPGGLWLEGKFLQAWKEELAGAKREILFVTCYHWYGKDPFPSAACKVAHVFTKSWAWR